MAASPEPLRLRLLVLSDVDIPSAISLAEQFIPQPPQFDAIVLCGPLSHHESSSVESEAVCEGYVSSVIAHLEDIVCRVVYVPGGEDPVRVINEQMHLTPNSINIHARSLPLHSGLYISGFTERDVDLIEKEVEKEEEESDKEEASLDPDEDKTRLQSSSSCQIIEEVLSASAAYCFPNINSEKSSKSPPQGIFVFNYKYAHSLNNFLFFQAQLAKQANLCLLVVPSFVDTNFEFPKVHNNYSIASPRSLRLESSYTTVELTYSQGDESNNCQGWTVTDVQEVLPPSMQKAKS